MSKKSKFRYAKKSAVTPPRVLAKKKRADSGQRSSPRSRSKDLISPVFSESPIPHDNSFDDDVWEDSPVSPPYPASPATRGGKRKLAGSPAAAVGGARPKKGRRQRGPGEAGSVSSPLESPVPPPPPASSSVSSSSSAGQYAAGGQAGKARHKPSKDKGKQKAASAQLVAGHRVLPLASASAVVRQEVAKLTQTMSRVIQQHASEEQQAKLGACLEQFVPVAAAIFQTLHEERVANANQYARAVANDISERLRLVASIKEALKGEKEQWTDMADELYTTQRRVNMAAFKFDLDDREQAEENLSVEMVELLEDFNKEITKEPSLNNALKLLSMLIDRISPLLSAGLQDAGKLKAELEAQHAELLAAHGQPLSSATPRRLVKNIITSQK